MYQTITQQTIEKLFEIFSRFGLPNILLQFKTRYGIQQETIAPFPQQMVQQKTERKWITMIQ